MSRFHSSLGNQFLRLTIQEVRRHQQLQSNFGRNREFWDFGRAVSKTHLVAKEHANFLEDMRPEKRPYRLEPRFEVTNLRKLNLRYFSKVHFVGFVFGKLSRTTQHGFNGSRRQSMFTFDNKFMAVRRNQLHIHCVGTFAAAVAFAVIFLLRNHIIA